MKVVGFHWDDEAEEHSNVRKIITKHGVTPAEVIEVFESAPVWLLMEEATDEGSAKYAVVGYTREGRMLEVHGCMYEDPPFRGWWRTFTAMDARPRFQRIYFNERGGPK